jgi:lysophospholipase L1-like esterase
MAKPAPQRRTFGILTFGPDFGQPSSGTSHARESANPPALRPPTWSASAIYWPNTCRANRFGNAARPARPFNVLEVATLRVLSTRRKLAYAATVTLVALVCLECAARLFELVRSRSAPPGVDAGVRARFHPLRYELVPGAVLPCNGARAQINSVGMRVPEPDQPKRRVRVLCLGDSCTFGYAPDVTDAMTYPAALQRMVDPARVEILNGGMLGFGSLDCWNFYLYKAVELEPDVLVILAGWNDYQNAHPLDPRVSPADPLASLSSYSALIRLEKKAVDRVIVPRSLSFAEERARLKRLPVPADRLSDVVFARTKRILEELVRRCRARQCAAVLVTYPSFTRDEWTDIDSLSDADLRPALSYLLARELSPRGWRKYTATTNALIREVALELDAPLVDGDAIRDPGLFHDLCHLKAAGNEALARRVAPILLRTIETRAKGRGRASR